MLALLSFEEVQPCLQALNLPQIDAAFWLSIRDNLTTLEDLRHWWDTLHMRITPVIEDAAYVQAAAALLPEEPWTAETWNAWIAAVKQHSGRKGKALFMPLRLALTGQPNGPELKVLLPLLGYARTHRRLRGEVA